MTVPLSGASRRRKLPTVSNRRSIGSLTSLSDEAPPNPQDVGMREEMIRQAAYFRSLHRRPYLGKEVEDWLAAEKEVDEWLARAATPPG